MARLPDSLDVGAPRGARLSGDTVRPTDFGLGDVAGAVEQVGQALATRDDRDAEKIIRNAQGPVETRFAELAAGYDGRESGFANKALASFENHFTAVTEDTSYSEGVRSAVRRRLDDYRADFGRRAIGVESQRRAGIVAEQVKVKEEARLGDVAIGFNTAFSAKYQARVDSFDGSDPNFANGVLADYDAEAEAALAAAPDDLKTPLQSRLNARRVQVHAQAMEAQDKAHDGFVAKNAERTLGALANNVLTNPAAYDTTLADLDTAAAGVPKALRADFIRSAKGEIAAARLEGLILKDDSATAKAELADGRYDAVLDPGKKSALMARADAAERGGPKSLEDWRAAYEAEDALESEVAARAAGSTTGFSLQSIAGVFSPRELASAERKLQEADRVFAATGNLRSQSTADLRARASAPPPDPTAPDYGRKQQAWELGRKAAAGELAAREKDPAGWAMTSEKPGDAGATIQTALKGYLEADTPEALTKAAGVYARFTLGMQQQAGIAPAAQRVLPKDQAADMVSAYARAPAAERPKALASLAAVWAALPSRTTMQDGRVVSPRAMAARELRAAGLGGADISALVDLSDNPGKLALYAEATGNPAALTKLTAKGQEATLDGQVAARLAPYFATANAAPGAGEQNAGRVARAQIMARQLVLVKGLTLAEAAKEATADLVDEYRFVDTWRMPVARTSANPPSVVRRGAAIALADLIGRDGQLLATAPGVGMTDPDRRRKSADIVENKGRWVTSEDDSGLTLMIPTQRGWTPAPDLHGRAVRLSWDQLEQIGRRGPSGKAGDWMAPAPAATAPRTVALPRARAAFTAAIEHQESRGNPQAVSPAGALGLRQLMIGTAKWQARMDGNKVFDGRSDAEIRTLLLSNPALNRRLSDNHIEYLSKRYDGNVGLMAAAYNAGPGAVDGWLKTYGDPRRGRVSLDEWVADIPFKETRNYVLEVLPRALKNLQRS
jgi:soluble lytic murein transglycosylase-like protein